MRVVGVGDNTVDKYLHLGKGFPGGNAVNVAVLARRFGHEASYIGWLGRDSYGMLLLDALREEHVDISHCRVVDGPNAFSEVMLLNGDRVFGKSSHGVSAQIALTDDDLAFIATHELVHTSIYSYLEKDIARLAKASTNLSFDFSQNWTKTYLTAMLPFVSIAVLSYPDGSVAELDALMQWICQQGPQLVLVTQGKNGANVFDGQKFYRQGIVETEIVDTLGAGDAFAARFLVEYLGGTAIEPALALAAQSAAETCGYYGAFGHGISLEALQSSTGL